MNRQRKTGVINETNDYPGLSGFETFLYPDFQETEPKRIRLDSTTHCYQSCFLAMISP